MPLSEEQLSLLWLSAAEITPKRVDELCAKYQSAVGIWSSFDHIASSEFSGTAKETLKHYHSRDAMTELCERMKQKGVQFLFRDSAEYPLQLREIDQPPYLLYYAGKTECLQMPMVAIVGSRNASSYGQEMAGLLAKGLCEAGACVVSGLARGIDAAAHRGALAVDGCTIGVLGSGINVPYPQEHTPLLRRIASGRGLILSEYPLDAAPIAYHFPHRNRIISGLSMGVIFAEGRIKSGGMNTVSSALNQGREVFAVPGRVGTDGAEGPLAILREGARIITSADDVLEDLGLRQIAPKKQKATQLSLFNPNQQRILCALSIGPLRPDEIAEKTGFSVDDILSELSILEIQNAVIRESGNEYSLPIQ